MVKYLNAGLTEEEAKKKALEEIEWKILYYLS
jgi:hypothetical protein